MMIENLHTFGNPVLLAASKAILFSSAVLLIAGKSAFAALVAPVSVVLLKEASEATTTKNTEKWMILGFMASISNIASLLSLIIAHEVHNEEDASLESYKFWIFGMGLQKFGAGIILYYLYLDIKSSSLLELESSEEDDEAVHCLEIKVSIKRGRDLVAKDTNIFGKHTTSDPYVKVYHGPNKLGKTAIIKKTLDPRWTDETFSLKVVPRALDVYRNIECNIYDHDKLSSDDPMGTVYIPIPRFRNHPVKEWYKVEKGEGDNYCQNPKGHLFVEVEVISKLNKSFKRQLLKTVSQRSMKSQNFAVEELKRSGTSQLKLSSRPSPSKSNLVSRPPKAA